MKIGMKLESDFLTNPAYRRMFIREGSPLLQVKKCGLEFVEFPIRSDFTESHYRGFVEGCRSNEMLVSLHPYPEGILNPAAFENKADNPCLKFAVRCLAFAQEVALKQGAPVPMTFHAASSARTAGLPWAREKRDFYFQRSRDFFLWLTDHIRANALSVKPMAELQLAPRPEQRFLRIGDTYDELLDVIEGIEGLEICWDMGHGVMNSMRYGLSKEPPAGFLRRVGHVHLHDILKGRDHHPLLYGQTPYRKYLRKLKHAGFDGYINLELTSSGINRAGSFSSVLGACVQKVLKAWHEG